MSFYISIDPGMKKCGLLLADSKSGKVLEAGIASLEIFLDIVSTWSKDYKITNILIGNGTNSNFIESQLKSINFFNIHYVNEKGSTFRARFRYWEIWQPNYFIRWIPKEILFPPNNLDAIVALILLEDFLNYSFIWPDKVDIKTWL